MNLQTNGKKPLICRKLEKTCPPIRSTHIRKYTIFKRAGFEMMSQLPDIAGYIGINLSGIAK